jgi:hypothetical protein
MGEACGRAEAAVTRKMGLAFLSPSFPRPIPVGSPNAIPSPYLPQGRNPRLRCFHNPFWQDGTKDILGLWIEQSEGAKFWLRVMNELKGRGVKDVLIAIVDGLKEAITAVFPPLCAIAARTARY